VASLVSAEWDRMQTFLSAQSTTVPTSLSPVQTGAYTQSLQLSLKEVSKKIVFSSVVFLTRQDINTLFISKEFRISVIWLSITSQVDGMIAVRFNFYHETVSNWFFILSGYSNRRLLAKMLLNLWEYVHF